MKRSVDAKKVLLVSSEPEDEIVDSLRRANCFVTKANDGASALALAKHVAVDFFVLISTGAAMTRTETALNLRDIRPSSEIILVTRDSVKLSPAEAAAQAISHTRVVSRQDLQRFLAPAES
jgi:DNA-binding response OmpR family regulator